MSIVPPSDIPVSLDYTGRDYYSIREQLIARVQDRIPECLQQTLLILVLHW